MSGSRGGGGKKLAVRDSREVPGWGRSEPPYQAILGHTGLEGQGGCTTSAVISLRVCATSHPLQVDPHPSP
eukprot:CAMPEP_0184716352 /NCGR_PEP_ID=MMETSP0314-20130426/6098_1 /TAXON_ID=38298 /ORGANISM="Rhodella maculata, Strain CCMP 736" /LENGTH=70 /DNA_ID=CAMNT_0027179733 /DNA_START=187 /DNA_END=397 /DNA_ORIENTATION=-